MKFRSKAFGAALVSVFAVAYPAFAQGEHKEKWEEMKKKHEECLKGTGFDQKLIDTLSDCHKGMKKDDKADKGGFKEALDGCLKEKGIVLTDAQKEGLKTCHGHHGGK